MKARTGMTSLVWDGWISTARLLVWGMVIRSFQNTTTSNKGARAINANYSTVVRKGRLAPPRKTAGCACGIHTFTNRAKRTRSLQTNSAELLTVKPKSHRITPSSPSLPSYQLVSCQETFPPAHLSSPFLCQNLLKNGP